MIKVIIVKKETICKKVWRFTRAPDGRIAKWTVIVHGMQLWNRSAVRKRGVMQEFAVFKCRSHGKRIEKQEEID